ncbi:MAG TPA: hypothetical protein VKV73_04210 [Chloroflexota bacterium]|nr:hypothetical protein [Chloroflexota bacterium]
MAVLEILMALYRSAELGRVVATLPILLVYPFLQRRCAHRRDQGLTGRSSWSIKT